MPRSKADKKKKEATPEEPEYVIEEILAHKRKNAELKYKIKWEGYDEITWEPEDNVPDGPVVKAYWAASDKPLDRYAPGSKQYREADKALKAAADSSKKSKKRAANASDEDEENEGKAKKRGRKSSTNGAAKNGAAEKGTKKAAAADDDDEEKEDAVDEEAEAKSQDNGYEVVEDREVLEDWAEVYGSKDNWEEDVKTLETIQQGENGNMAISVVWKDDRLSYVDLAVARVRCPQHVIDFFIGHLKFKPTEPVDDDDE
ncbi:hypothetical protein JCM3770_002312 [Rhodotorula araucariae]